MATEYTLTETVTETRRYTVILPGPATEEQIREQAYGSRQYVVEASEVTDVSISPEPTPAEDEEEDEDNSELN